MSSEAWVVTCTGCKCCITCFGIDSQAEHGMAKKPPLPQNSVILSCLCCGSDYRYTEKDMVRGVPKRNPLCRRAVQRQPMDGALLVAASIVAAIRLRGQEITGSPKLVAVVSDSVRLARTVMEAIERDR